MARTKAFVSYSSQDRKWLSVLKTHLSFLEREGLVHVWSDTSIDIGARWEEEIERALEESRVAILMVSPDFLASKFIWEVEMPKIVAHERKGMLILPLLIRPCAWKLSDVLSRLQVRPQGARPLALGTEVEIDLGLAEFVYELAARIERLPETIASEEADNIHAWRVADLDVKTQPSAAVDERSKQSSMDDRLPIERGQEWQGEYKPTNLRMKLVVEGRNEHRFSGRIIYTDYNSVTRLEGRSYYDEDLSSLKRFYFNVYNAALKYGVEKFDCVIEFSELEVMIEGSKQLDVNGVDSYCGAISGNKMVGIYIRGGKEIGQFFFERVS